MSVVLWGLAAWVLLSLPVGIIVGRVIRYGAGGPLPAANTRRAVVVRASSPWARPAR